MMHHLVFSLLLAAVFGSDAGAQEPMPPLLQGRPLVEWRKDLHSTDPRLRLPAIALLGALGDKAKEDLPQLKKLLRAEDAATRIATVNALARIGGPEAFEVLVFAWGAKDPAEQRIVEAAMHTIHPSVKGWVRALLELRFHADIATGEAALHLFRSPGSWRHAAVPELVTLAQSGRPALQREACTMLGWFGADAVAAAPALAQLLEDRECQVEALHALLKVPASPELLLTPLTRLVGNPDAADPLRAAAAGKLRQWGAAARPALPPLRRAMQAESMDLRLAAAAAVVAIENDDKAALHVLRAGLNNPSVHTRHEAAELLCELGSAARALIPALTEDLQAKVGDPFPVAVVLLKLAPGHPQADAFMRRMLKEPRQQDMALISLRLLGPEAKPFLAEVKQLGRSGNAQHETLAQEVLRLIDPDTAAKRDRK